uniref:(northern house mosquito) hypothetical protein n=1 Tax=Culex pipiens TaxID=7175 RepID=A0A8D8JYY4_CULPI
MRPASGRVALLRSRITPSHTFSGLACAIIWVLTSTNRPGSPSPYFTSSSVLCSSRNSITVTRLHRVSCLSSGSWQLIVIGLEIIRDQIDGLGRTQKTALSLYPAGSSSKFSEHKAGGRGFDNFIRVHHIT